MSGDNQQATAWLSGLIDTDGTVSLSNGPYNTLTPFVAISNTNPEVIACAVEVIHSLGVGCHVSWQDNNRGRDTHFADLGHIHVTGHKRVPALLRHLTLYAKHWRAEMLLDYIEYRQSLPKRTPYSEVEYSIKRRLNSQWEPQRLHAMPSDYSWLAGVVDGDGVSWCS